MQASKEPDWRALTAFLMSEHSEQQGTEVQRWLAQSPDHVELLGILHSATAHGDRPSSPDERAQIWAAIQDRIARPSDERVAAGAMTHRASRIAAPTGGLFQRPVLRWAAVACAAIVVAVGFGGLLNRQLPPSVVQPNVVSMQEVTTQPGQRATVRLPDGSTVVLGVASHLRYATSFDRSERDVYLTGQAFFTVTHASGWPFVVHAGNVTARVLGTRFMVRRYAADTAARVVVAQGRVTVQHQVLRAGDAVMAGPHGNAPVTHGTDVEQALAWTDGRLRFVGTPLAATIPELERSLGVTITVDDSTLLSEPVTASLENESPREALQIIATVTHARVVWDHDQVVLSRP